MSIPNHSTWHTNKRHTQQAVASELPRGSNTHITPETLHMAAAPAISCRGASTSVPAAFGDQPTNFNALATTESDGRDQREGLLPLAATNVNEEREVGGGTAGPPAAAMAEIRLVAGAGGWRSRPVQRGRPGSARRAQTGEPHSHKQARGGRRHPRCSDKTRLLK